MPSLKEVKNRINSVNSTRKITSAMKMVASAKLHSAQKAIESMRPYETRLARIMGTFVSTIDGDITSPYAVERPVQRVALVVYTSNSSLCGAFNGNVIRELRHAVARYQEQGCEVVGIYPLGKKGLEAVRKLGAEAQDYSSLLDHPAYAPAAEIAQELMDKFAAGEIDRVDLIYHHFKSAGSQVLTKEQFLPVRLEEESADGVTAESKEGGFLADYIVEPSKEELLLKLIPKALHLKLYTALLDSLASEHAARVIAMQVATDNADELLHDLTLQYNKTRQQAITAELLDIVGGSMQ
ncbi:MAG: F0F1 ATP synthase subunit gamma [Alloprevotella sp.]|nr:F0F1 ATP synthase subunit gamma [Alloprevotella sp.]